MYTLQSKDGTRIAYDKIGSGEAVILVDGAFCSRGFGPMSKIAALLSKTFTVYTYDRRGRGDSGDTKPYSVQREIDDVNALIGVAGGEARLFGISSGAMLCLEAAAVLPVKKIAVFEPPYVKNYRKKPVGDFLAPLKKLVEEGDKGGAVQFYLRAVMGVPAIVPFLLRLTPNWRKMKANAAALVYDATIAGDFSIPTATISAIEKPVLVLCSNGSPAILQRPAEELSNLLPDGRYLAVKGGIHDVPAKIVVPVLDNFFKVNTIQ